MTTVEKPYDLCPSQSPGKALRYFVIFILFHALKAEFKLCCSPEMLWSYRRKPTLQIQPRLETTGISCSYEIEQ